MAHITVNAPLTTGLPTGWLMRLLDSLRAVKDFMHAGAPNPCNQSLSTLGERELADIGLRRFGDTPCLRDRYHRI
ncbi:MAG: hypothetical protein AB3N23_21910 [Paracoccaceae bacterium]